VITVQH